MLDDWTLLLFIITFLTTSVTVGSEMQLVGRALRLMYRFKNPEPQLLYAPFSLLRQLIILFQASLNIALLILCSNGLDLDHIIPSITIGIDNLLRVTCIVVATTVLKLVLYHIFNALICGRFSIPVTHFRWFSFTSMVYAVVGCVAFLLNLFVIFIHFPIKIAVILLLLAYIILEIGTLFRLKTSFLKKKCPTLIFFLYLCTLEIVPLAFMWLILNSLY